MSELLLIIDGSSLLSTHYHGNLPRELQGVKEPEKRAVFYPKILQTSTGIYTNAMYGMLKSILKIIDQIAPSHMCVVWDVTRNTFRKNINAEYKGNRKVTDEPLKQQFIHMQDFFKEIGVPQLMSSTEASLEETYEGDDYAGSMARRFEKEIPTVLMTKDNDYLQLVSDWTRLWLVSSKAKELGLQYYKEGIEGVPEGVIELTPSLVKAYQGVWPKQCLDLKALCGDASDNISGVKGVGEKSAIPLINEYETIENLYQQIENLTAEEEKALKLFWKNELGIVRSPLAFLLKESTQDQKLGKEAALESKALGRIKTDIPIEQPLSFFKVDIDQDKLEAQCRKYEFKSLLGEKNKSKASSGYKDSVKVKENVKPKEKNVQQNLFDLL